MVNFEMVVKRNLSKFDWSTWIFAGLAIGTGILISLLIMVISNPLHLFVVVAGMLGVLAMVRWNDFGLIVLVFTTYTRFSDIMIKYHGVPSIAKLLVPLLFGIVFVRWAMFSEQPKGWQRSALVVFGYGFIGFLSLLYAADYVLTETALLDYAKDATIIILVTMMLHRAGTLRYVIWTMIAVGIFLGSITVFQQLTGTFENNYWGFGQAKIRNIVGESADYRVSGPVGGPNEYAQMLLILVPLALDRLWNERKLLLRIFAAWSLSVCILSIIFTFSRGGFVAMAGMLIIMFVRRPPNLLALLITILVAVPLVQFVPQQYTDRMQTMFLLIPGSEGEAREDISFRGRLSENLSAWLMFTDYPLIGVGLDNYKVHYQQYSRQLGVDPRREARDPHSLYLELAAEQGLLGLAAFGVMMWIVFRGLHQASQDFYRAGMPDYVNITVALAIGLIAYLIASTFLHLLIPRFLWLLIGITLAVPQIAKNELNAQQETLDGV
jgi:O-antigen ligase